ncbi:MAG: 3-oxoacyl-ACP synthase III [Deltaproteobacteria bacterium]|jgi:3-oxoacyl-[acyl-carrier-protein] synthase-3|nr:3-oxoacyl-ACP synthase III [Deltaproteobacteria bacterium]
MKTSPHFTKVAIVAHARDLGSERLTTAAVEQVLAPLLTGFKISPQIILSLTSIESRFLYPRDSPPSRGAEYAAQKLFDRTGFDPQKIDILYSTSVGRDFLEPSTASILHSRLGLSPECTSLDLGSACLGFLEGLYLAALQVEYDLIDYALILAGENSRLVLENTFASLQNPELTLSDFFKHFATLTLGSGGAAMLVGSASNFPYAPRLKNLVSLTDPFSNDLCRGNNTFMHTDSTNLLIKGVELAAKTFQKGEKAFGWSPDTFNLYVCHQVSEANTRKLAEKLDLPWDKILKTYPHYGNMGPVAIPFTFDLARELNLVQPGVKVALMGIGSGLACAFWEVEIPEDYPKHPY